MIVALDHVSVRAAPPGVALDGHRVMLDRSYLEVGHEGEPLLFLRPERAGAGDPRAGCGGPAAIGEAARLLGREPVPFTGRDGEWLDLELAGPVALTRRVAPQAIARDWPPPRAGAPSLQTVRVRGDAAALLDPLEALGGPPPGLVVDHAPGEPLRIVGVLLSDGVQVL
ncbi:MAG TPA: hypothetical protein VF549_00760 [Solirubrobacteraceae bacterium]